MSHYEIEKSSIYRGKKETRDERIRIRLNNLIPGAHCALSSNQKLQTFSFYRDMDKEILDMVGFLIRLRHMDDRI